MSNERAIEPDLQGMIEDSRTIRPIPDVVRARALARARAALASEVLLAPPRLPPSGWQRWRFALAAAAAFAVGAVSASAAFLVRMPGRGDTTRPSPPSVERAGVLTGARPALPDLDPPAVDTPTLRRRGRSVAAEKAAAVEAHLLQRAHAAFVAHDYAGALALVGEHARRFPNGRFVEEREAIRVRSLAATGHADQAQRASAAFAARFPRSVLGPGLDEP